MNRTIEQKKLKMKRRNRFVIFSGKETKYATRIDRGKYQDVTTTPDGDKVPSGHNVVIPVGPISLSKAVINTGRGPDKERLQSYYARLKSFDTPIPPTKGLTEPQKEMLAYQKTDKYKQFVLGAAADMHINWYKDDQGRLDLHFSGRTYFWVEINYKKKFWRRSETYPSKDRAVTFLQYEGIRWVETISPD